MQMRVLVVDDEAVDRHVACSLLEATGCVVLCVSDGAEALIELQRGAFDVVLSDVAMPKLDGLGLLREIQSQKLCVRTVLMTREATPELRAVARRAGARELLEKPLEAESLLCAIA